MFQIKGTVKEKEKALENQKIYVVKGNIMLRKIF